MVTFCSGVFAAAWVVTLAMFVILGYVFWRDRWECECLALWLLGLVVSTDLGPQLGTTPHTPAWLLAAWVAGGVNIPRILTIKSM